MTRRQKTVWSLRSITSAALVGFGVLSLNESLAAAGDWLNRVVIAGPPQLPRVLSVLLSIRQVVQALTVHHEPVLQYVLQHTLVSSWPLLLVACGTALSWDTLNDKVGGPRNKFS